MMIFLVSSSAKLSSFGAEDYSYYFVLKQFRPVLERLGLVVEVGSVTEDVDRIYRQASRYGVGCVFLCFSPPHKVEAELACPTVPVFAWEYGTIPNEVWSDNPKNDWVSELKKYCAAITHSEHTVEVTKKALGDDFSISSIPAPIWDQYSQYFDPKADLSLDSVIDLRVQGWVLDSRDLQGGLDRRTEAEVEHNVRLSGVVYTSVFTPNDGRKNWQDLLSAFCYSFRDIDDATLVLKLTHTDPKYCFEVVYSELKKLQPFKGRVLVIQGYLDADDYAELISATKYSVNSSFGEGQCLPLMEYMSAGKPSVAPNHTGMADYITDRNSFIVEFSNQWVHWPHDPRQLLKTFRQQIDWGSLCGAYLQSYQELKQCPELYRCRSHQAHQDLKLHCSDDRVLKNIDRIVSSIKGQRIRQRVMRPVYRTIYRMFSALGLRVFSIYCLKKLINL